MRPKSITRREVNVMVENAEIRWEYDVVEVGQTGPKLTIEVTEELIATYAKAVRNPNPNDASFPGG